MPEGDVVWRTARRLNLAFAGQPLAGAELRWGNLGGTSLHGLHTVQVASRGKHLMHRFDNGMTLHSHLRMEGSWRLRRTPTVTPAVARGRTIRALLATPEWAAIGTSLGMLDLLPTRDEDRLVGHLGPDLLGDDWDPQVAVANLRRAPDRLLGEALLDQRNLAGLGTVWVAEPLFVLGINPWRRVGEVDDRLDAIVRTAQRMMQSEAVADRADHDGAVHSRSGLPCVRCGSPVRVARIGAPPRDRVLFYCPHCQQGLAPTDDGQVQSPLSSTRDTMKPRR